jgi:hypothetical protein
MDHVSRGIFAIVLFFQFSSVVRASPDYLFEWLLPRAETAFIGRITRHTEQDVSLEITERLRGDIRQNTLTFRYSAYDDRRLPELDTPFLVISQGDNYFGKPQSRISLGQHVKGQAGYCGWIAFPLRVDRGVLYLDLIRTLAGQEHTENPARLTLSKARTLIQRIPYKPDLNDSGLEQLVRPERRKRGS